MMSDRQGYSTDGAGYLSRGGGYSKSRMIDGFERGNLTPYRNTGGFSTTTTHPSEGSYALYGNGNKSTISTPGDGLPYYPVRGDTIKFDVYFPDRSGTQVTFGYATAAVDEGYEVQFRFDRNEIYWVETDSGDEYNAFDRQSHTFPTGSWRTCTIDWGNNGQTLEYDGVTLRTGAIRADSNLDSGGIYYRVADRNAFFDNVRAI